MTRALNVMLFNDPRPDCDSALIIATPLRLIIALRSSSPVKGSSSPGKPSSLFVALKALFVALKALMHAQKDAHHRLRPADEVSG